ncbi:ankyrin repeat domain-containing protein [Streptomyces sp. AP-93]|uniref:ankyrin repeat domain-containing protein n=1 Tax=Streptomyces sp. AP-93 TaxID=2929048 RepID=UPI001FAF8B60|nr:ankyrin repeat domain-containing protein [Streptomyces sp. AP-93]MCJ0869421.1 ankyrin repeat domain-containing protein [Streptomyces sp. AP-93]
MLSLASDDPLAVAVTAAIRDGDLAGLRRLLARHPGLAGGRILKRGEAAGERSLLHIAVDWPGHYPRTAQVIRTLVAAGADPGARFVGSHRETPLHWAASNDDVTAIDALVEAGADIEAPGSVLGGGGPLADATGFGQWRAARRLLELGARPSLQEAAALGLLAAVEGSVAAGADPEEVTRAFWGACHGGQLSTAQYLLSRGADINRIGHGGLTPLDIALTSGDGPLIDWLGSAGARTRDEIPRG